MNFPSDICSPSNALGLLGSPAWGSDDFHIWLSFFYQGWLDITSSFTTYVAPWRTLNVNSFYNAAVWTFARSLSYCIQFPWWSHGPAKVFDDSLRMSSPRENIMLLCAWKILASILLTFTIGGLGIHYSVCNAPLPPSNAAVTEQSWSRGLWSTLNSWQCWHINSWLPP